MSRHSIGHALRVAFGGAALALLACSGASTTDTIASAIADATSASGTLMCTPSQDQLAACADKAAGAACSFTGLRDGATVPGTCRPTVDGAAVACAPNPPPPPPALVQACENKAVGDECVAPDPFGGTHPGACVTARDGSTVLCAPIRQPPPQAIEACAELAVGAACQMPPRPDGSTPPPGVCSLGPAGAGPLACAPPHDALPRAVEACADHAAGDPCQLPSRDGPVGGTCVAPPDGRAPICLVQCGALGGPFHCGDGGGGMGGPGPGPFGP